MMSVSEYANDVDKSLDYIFELCKKLNISANQADDMLSDDDIILLDNEIENATDEMQDEEKEIYLKSRRRETRCAHDCSGRPFTIWNKIVKYPSRGWAYIECYNIDC